MFNRGAFIPSQASKSTDKLRALALELIPQFETQVHRVKSIELDWIEDGHEAGPLPKLKVEFYE